MAVFDALADFGDAPALICDSGRALSFAELSRDAAAAVAPLGRDRQLVVIEMRNALEPVLAYVGALSAGHAVILTAEGGAQSLQAFAPFSLFSGQDGTWRWHPSSHAAAGLHPALALMLSTSGSTGSPKLVRLSSGAVEANARSIAEYLGIGPGERAITSLPLYYSYGLSVLHSHLLAGATVCLTDEPVTSEAFWRIFDEAGCTSFAGVPYSYALLERRGFRDHPPATLRTMTQAGGRLPPELAAEYIGWSKARGLRFFIMYGQTEATARIAYLPPDAAESHPDCIGVAIPGGTLDLAPLPDTPAERGELVYRGPNVMMGYATERAHLAQPAELEELRTGDVAERTEDGLFRIVGRLSRFSKIGGKRVALDDLEAALADAGQPGTVAANDELIAVWTRDPQQGGAADHLVERFGLPASAVVWAGGGEVPRLPSGKTDYPAILAAAAERVAQRRRGAATLEASLAAILGRSRINPRLSFDELGADSLAYVQASIAVEEAMGELPDDWASRPIAELSATSGPLDGSSWRPAPTEILVRVLAACAVVIGHTPGGSLVKGGALTLFLLTGYSLAAHQGGRLLGDRPWQVPLSFAVRVLVPYYLLMLFMAATSKDVTLTPDSLLLYSNLTGVPRGPLMPYWFLETMLQCLVLLAALLSLERVRRGAQRDPLGFFLLLSAGAIALHFLVPFVWQAPRIAEWPRSPDVWGYLLPLGAAMALARSTALRIGLLAVLLFLVWLDYGLDSTRVPFVGVMIGAILFMPRPRLPAMLAKALTTVAAASLFIYLVHMLAVQVTVHELGIEHWLPALLLSLALGIAGHAVWRWVLAQGSRLVGRREPVDLAIS